MNLHRGLAIIHQLIRGLADSNCTASSLTNNNRHCDQQYRRQLLLILELRPFISVSVCLSLSVPFSFSLHLPIDVFLYSVVDAITLYFFVHRVRTCVRYAAINDHFSCHIFTR